MTRIARIYLIRHGETASNVGGRFRGRANIPLSENGLIQAKSLANELRDVELSAIYSGPLSRAMETAKILAHGRNTEVIRRAEFQNIDLGKWTDRPKNEIAEEYPQMWQQWITEPENLVLPGGECVIDVRDRAFTGIMRLVGDHPDGSFAIVSHRAVLKPLIAAALGIEKPFFWKIHLDTAGYSLLEYNETRGFTLVHLNLTHYLDDYVVEKI